MFKLQIILSLYVSGKEKFYVGKEFSVGKEYIIIIWHVQMLYQFTLKISNVFALYWAIFCAWYTIVYLWISDRQNFTSELNISYGILRFVYNCSSFWPMSFIQAISHFQIGNTLIINHAFVPHKPCFNVILPTGANLRYVFSIVKVFGQYNEHTRIQKSLIWNSSYFN